MNNTRKLLEKIKRKFIAPGKLQKQRGFTLVELLVVLVILGTLMAVLFVNIQDTSSDVDPVVHKANRIKIDAAIFKFKNQCGRLPRPEEGLQALVSGPTDIEACAGKSFLKENQIKHNNCPYKYSVDEQGQYSIIWLGADCAEGGEGNNADKDIADI